MELQSLQRVRLGTAGILAGRGWRSGCTSGLRLLVYLPIVKAREMEARPRDARGWFNASLLVAKVFVVAGTCLAYRGVFRFVPARFQAAILIAYAAAALLLFVGGIIQMFTPERYEAPLNLLVGLFAWGVIAILLPALM